MSLEAVIKSVVSKNPELEQFRKAISRRSPSTQESYLTTARSFLTHVGKPLERCTKQDVDDFLDALKQGKVISRRLRGKKVIETRRKPVKDRSLYRHAYALKAFFEECGREDLATDDLVDIDYDEALPLWLTPEQYNEVLKKLDDDDKLIIEVGYQCALRIGELLTLKRKDVNLKACIIRVTRKKRKRGIKEHDVEITEDLAQRLADYLSRRTDNFQSLFLTHGGSGGSNYRPLTRHTAESILDRALEKSGVYMELKEANPDREPSWHILRHSRATHLAIKERTPYQIAAVTGHKRLDTILTYIHLGDVYRRSSTS